MTVALIIGGIIIAIPVLLFAAYVVIVSTITIKRWRR